jgi:hypothetical protein
MVVLAAIALIAAGCGSSDSSSNATTATAAATTGVAASDGDVAAGLAQMVTIAGETALETVTDGAAGKAAAGDLETRWAPIEDVVKANEPDTYVDIEDAMALLESGDATKAAAGAARLTTAVTGYVAKHPG